LIAFDTLLIKPFPRVNYQGIADE